jgi:DNA-binding CsgD family transcriptional regulator
VAPSLFSTVREGKVALALLEALGSSLDIRLVLERAYPLLLQLVSGDYGALGISSSGRSDDYEWIVAKIPTAFFAAYPEMASHDFVRTSVAKRPNVVLRDHEMVSRSALEGNVMYRRAREVGAPLEQVMSVMLHIDDRWQSGLSVYRERRRPFSDREAAALRRVTPSIVSAVRHCHLFGAAQQWGAALERLLHDQAASIILVAPPATEVARTTGATRLVDAWFAPHERRSSWVPTPLVAFVTQATGRALGQEAPAPWTRRGPEATLTVSFVPLADCAGKARGMLVFREESNAGQPVPVWRAILTGREQAVCAAVARGWDNRTIAAELGCAEATVKKHLQNIFDKVGVESRTALVARAAENRRP